MGKLAVLYVLIAFAVRYLYRRRPETRRRISGWFVLFGAALVLLLLPGGDWTGPVDWSRLAVAVAILGYILFDMRKAMLARPWIRTSAPRPGRRPTSGAR